MAKAAADISNLFGTVPKFFQYQRDCLQRVLQIEPDNTALFHAVAEARAQRDPPQPRRDE